MQGVYMIAFLLGLVVVACLGGALIGEVSVRLEKRKRADNSILCSSIAEQGDGETLTLQAEIVEIRPECSVDNEPAGNGYSLGLAWYQPYILSCRGVKFTHYTVHSYLGSPREKRAGRQWQVGSLVDVTFKKEVIRGVAYWVPHNAAL